VNEESVPWQQFSLLRRAELLDFMLDRGITVGQVDGFTLLGLRILTEERKKYTPAPPLQPKWGKSFDI